MNFTKVNDRSHYYYYYTYAGTYSDRQAQAPTNVDDRPIDRSSHYVIHFNKTCEHFITKLTPFDEYYTFLVSFDLAFFSFQVICLQKRCGIISSIQRKIFVRFFFCLNTKMDSKHNRNQLITSIRKIRSGIK